MIRGSDGPAHDDSADARLLQDWAAIWASEMSAGAADPERAAAWAWMAAHWSAWAKFAADGAEPRPASGAAREPSVGSAPAAAASDAGRTALAEVSDRLAELERKLAERLP